MKIDKPQPFILRQKIANFNLVPDWFTYNKGGNLLIDIAQFPAVYDPIYDWEQPNHISYNLPTTGNPVTFNQTLTKHKLLSVD